MEIGPGTEAMMDTTLSPTTSLDAARTGTGRLLRVAVATLSGMRRAIVNGPSDGCWRSVDGAAQTAFLPARERARLLDAGLALAVR